MPIKAAIVCLTENTPARVGYLVGSLARLFDAFNSRSGYPVLICHEGDFSKRDADALRSALPGDLGTALEFVELDAEDFRPPHWMSNEIVGAHRTLVPDARDTRYRTMTRWWLRDLPKYLSGYDAYMRLDDDAYIDERTFDPIAATIESGTDYASNCVHIEHPLNALGLAGLSRQLLGDSARLTGLFLSNNARPPQHGLVEFARGLPLHLREMVSLDALDAPIMYYNNFHVARRCVWESAALRTFYDAIDESGGQYFLRWGDAPIQTIGLVALGFSLGRFDFRYSKRYERADGAFVNCNHELATPFMDASVDLGDKRVGSMTEFDAFNRMMQERGIADIGRKIVGYDREGQLNG